MESLGNDRDSSRPYAVIPFPVEDLTVNICSLYFQCLNSDGFFWFGLPYLVYFPLQNVTIPLEIKTAFKFLFKPTMDGNIWSWNT